MYDRLLELYCSGRLSDAGLDNAVAKKWITSTQAAEIRAEKQRRDNDVIGTIITDLLKD